MIFQKNCMVILLVTLITLSSSLSNAYDGEVHKIINEKAAEQTQILRNVLINQLGMQPDPNKPDILDKIIGTRSIKEWIAFGGDAEDYGWLGKYDVLRSRAFNHFHDPLKDWDDAGLDNALNLVYWRYYFRYPVSTILWGLKPEQQDFTMNLTGDWSWGKARKYYYDALTKQTVEERNQNFADCFRAVGQVMHLLEDMSVPLHTRNDLHVFPIMERGRWNYETYTKEYLDDLNLTAHRPDLILLTDPLPDPNYNNLVPASGLFDRNQYNKGSDLPENNNIIGLAEYSNANFLTQDTMWDYQHPALDDTTINEIYWTNPELVNAEDGKTDKRVYIKFKDGMGEDIEHLAAVDYFTIEYQGHTDIVSAALSLDKKCWDDYANKLIPRAVGYSAALLDYFFRGAIEITLPDSGVYALADKVLEDIDPASEGFDSMTVYAINNSPDGEEMTGGTVTLVVKYRLGQGDQFQNPPTATSYEFHYIVKELDGIQTIPRITPDTPDPIEFEFDLSDNQIPLWATDVYIYLIYKGGLGREEGAVAVGFKDISEPTPILYYNVMDQICMDDQLFDSGSSEAIAYVDTDEDGVVDPDEWDVYPHNAENIHIRYSPLNNPQDATPETSADNNYEKAILHPNEYFRLFILTDYDFNRSTSVEYTKIVDEDQCILFHGIFPRPSTVMDAIKNQIELVDPVYCGYEPCYARFITKFHSIRGMVSFFSVLFDNASNPIDSVCSYE